MQTAFWRESFFGGQNNSSFHTILGKTAKLITTQDVTSFTETDNFVAFRGINCFVWNSNSIAILTKNRY
jgi:hypothetical protein